MEIQVTCFHESRHAFQWKVITGEYTGTEIVDLFTVQKWEDEMSNYNSPTKKDIPEEKYFKQEIEIDAISFAHFLMNKLYDVNTLIPEMIQHTVENKLRLYKNRMWGDSF